MSRESRDEFRRLDRSGSWDFDGDAVEFMAALNAAWAGMTAQEQLGTLAEMYERSANTDHVLAQEEA